MCQLTFINTNYGFSNKLFAVSQALINTNTEHRDGFGFYSNNKLHKSDNYPWLVTDYANYLNFITSNPVIMHVRKASYVNANKKIDIEHTHPFESDNFILAHNGTLESKKDLIGPGYGDMIDSQVFLAELDKVYATEKDFVKALNLTMELFTGKFAFLIYEKSTTHFYAARGEVATLHHFPITIFDNKNNILSAGYILNTELISLNAGLVQFSNLLMVNKLHMNYEHPSKDVTLLPENSIYLLNRDKPEKIGEIKEGKKVFVTAPYWNTVNNRWAEEDYEGYVPVKVDKYPPVEGTPRATYKKLFKFMVDWSVDLWYIDTISWVLNEKSLVCLDDEEFKYFLDCLGFIDKANTLEMSKMWVRIRKSTGFQNFIIHNKFPELEFPYMLNDVKKLGDALDKYEEFKKVGNTNL